jgi:MHS family proline/betaine transporter-like MFS transporter
MAKGNLKILALVLCGNILDYYDFLLFAHLGQAITAFFIPSLSLEHAHLISLLLFSLSFVVRPIGGYLFGRISDSQGRAYALGKTLKYAGFASLGLGILPTYQTGGMVCTVLFFLLRGMQGLSLGGEYTTAGTFLMERYERHQGLISGILAASGTIGSLFAFSFAWVYLNGNMAPWMWRIAFIAGATATYLSYLLRSKLRNHLPPTNIKAASKVKTEAMLITFLIGALVGVTCWLPMAYSNFYLTKVLHLPLVHGLKATFIALVLYVPLNVLFGYISDWYSAKRVMAFGALLSIPLGVIGYYFITKGLLVGQVFLILASAIFGAPIHVIMNQLFPPASRSSNINTLFMLGSSIGGLTPFISGYFADHYGFYWIPVVILSLTASITLVFFYRGFSFYKMG